MKRLNLKKLATTLLTLALAGSTLLTGCADAGGASASAPASAAPGASNGSEPAAPAGTPTEAPSNMNLDGYPILKEKETFTMMGIKHPIHGDWKNMVFFQEMEQMTNVAFDFDTPTLEVAEEKKNLALNGGTYQDVFFGAMLTREQQVKYGSQGILIPLEGYLEAYCPNLSAILAEHPDIKKSITAPDGHIYSLPQILEAPIAMTPTMWMNQKWLDAMGVTEDQLPTTTDGFYELLKQMKTSDANGNGVADEIPFCVGDDGASKGATLYNNFFPSFGMKAPLFYADDDGKIQFGYAQENAKAAFEWFHKLWDEELLDRDTFIQGSAEMSAKGNENLIGCAYHALPRLIYGAMDLEEEARYVVLPALSSPVYDKQAVLQTGSGLNHGTFAITDKCQEPEVLLRWVDYIYSPEGSIFIHYGPEGNLWKFNENNLRVYIQPEDGRNVEEKRGGEITPECGIPCPKYTPASTESSWDDVQQQARIKEVDEKIWPYATLPLPDMFFTAEEQAQLDVMTTDLSKYCNENAAKFVTGDKPLSEYDGFVQGLKNMGIDEMIALYQTAYDRWAANGK